jgi:hypothetical protein
MSRTYVRNRKRSKTEWVSRPQAESQHAWGLVGLHSHFCAGIEGQLCGFGLPWLSQSPVVLVVAPRNSLESRRSSAVSGDY